MFSVDLMKKALFFTLLLFPLALRASPEIQPSQQEGAVGFIASLKPGPPTALEAAVKNLTPEIHEKLEARGISGLRFYTEEIGGSRVVLASFDMKPGTDPDQAWAAAALTPELKPWFSELSGTLTTGSGGNAWQRCETICQLRPRLPTKPHEGKSAWHAGICRLRPEKEAEYRLLHNHVWPGVIDAIGEAMTSRFDIFFLEIGGQPLLFHQLQYVGADFKKDMAGMAGNPVNQRWWKQTDPCQQPLPSAAARKQIWEPMEALPTP